MNDHPELPHAGRRLWASKGEAVTCVNGHAICTVARNIMVGEPHSPDNFTDWTQPEPSRDTPITEIRCTVPDCRSVWIRQGSTAYQFHFCAPPHGEWR